MTEHKPKKKKVLLIDSIDVQLLPLFSSRSRRLVSYGDRPRALAPGGPQGADGGDGGGHTGTIWQLGLGEQLPAALQRHGPSLETVQARGWSGGESPNICLIQWAICMSSDSLLICCVMVQTEFFLSTLIIQGCNTGVFICIYCAVFLMVDLRRLKALDRILNIIIVWWLKRKQWRLFLVQVRASFWCWCDRNSLIWCAVALMQHTEPSTFTFILPRTWNIICFFLPVSPRNSLDDVADQSEIMHLLTLSGIFQGVGSFWFRGDRYTDFFVLHVMSQHIMSACTRTKGLRKKENCLLLALVINSLLCLPQLCQGLLQDVKLFFWDFFLLGSPISRVCSCPLMQSGLLFIVLKFKQNRNVGVNIMSGVACCF